MQYTGGSICCSQATQQTPSLRVKCTLSLRVMHDMQFFMAGSVSCQQSGIYNIFKKKKTIEKDVWHAPHAAVSPASPAAPQSTWRWPGLSETCPDSLWQAPAAGAGWSPALHQLGAEHCLGNTLQWCQEADPPSVLSPAKTSKMEDFI